MSGVVYAPVFIDRQFTLVGPASDQGPVLGTQIRHSYRHPILVDEIRFMRFQGSAQLTEVKMFLGRLPIVDYVSPLVFTQALDPIVFGASLVGGGGFIQESIGLGAALTRWVLPKPMLMTPEDQLNIFIRGTAADSNIHVCVVGRALPSNFKPPEFVSIPYVTGLNRRLVGLTPANGAAIEFESVDNELNNPLDEDLNLHSFGIWTSGGQNEPAIAPPGTEVRISDSQGGYIIKDPVSIFELALGNSRVWRVSGNLPSRQFWTVNVKIPFPLLTADVIPAGQVFFVMAAICGWRDIPFQSTIQMSKDEYNNAARLGGVARTGQPASPRPAMRKGAQ